MGILTMRLNDGRIVCWLCSGGPISFRKVHKFVEENWASRDIAKLEIFLHWFVFKFHHPVGYDNELGKSVWYMGLRLWVRKRW